jgi:hypothetical protein
MAGVVRAGPSGPLAAAGAIGAVRVRHVRFDHLVAVNAGLRALLLVREHPFLTLPQLVRRQGCAARARHVREGGVPAMRV